MLQALRDGAHSGFLKFILFGLLVLGVAGLVLMDVGGVFRGGVGSNDVATMKGEKVSIRQFDRTVSGILRQQGLEPQTAYRLGYVHQILMSELRGRMLRRKAQELGLMVSDAQVAEQIRTLIAPLTDENTSAQQALDQVLRAQGMSEAQFVDTVRQEMTSTLLRQALLPAAQIVPEPLARDLYAQRNETRAVEYLSVDYADIDDIGEPEEGELEAFYETVRERYAIPERRDVTVAVLDPEVIEETVGVTDEELRALYEESLPYYQKPETRTIEQALAESSEDAQAIYQRVRDGASMDEAVRAVTGSEEHYLGSERYEREGLIEAVADAAFALGEGDVSEPVETALGWHVLKVTEITPPETTPFEDVREDLRAERVQVLLADQLFEEANIIDDMIAGGAPLEEAVEAHGLKTVNLEDIDRTGTGPEDEDALEAFSADRSDILETAFSLFEGEIAPVLELSDGRYVFIRASAVRERSYPELSDVRDSVRGDWESRQREKKALMLGAEALETLREGGALADIAANAYGNTPGTATISRNEDSEALPPRARAKFFDTAIRETAMAATQEGVVVGRVTDITPADPDKAPEEDIAQLTQSLSRQIPNEIMLALTARLAEEYKLIINEELLERAYGGGPAAQ